MGSPRICCDGNVLGDGVERTVRLRTKPLQQLRFSRELMRELSVLGHEFGVCGRCAGEIGVQSQRRRPCLRPRCIGQPKQL